MDMLESYHMQCHVFSLHLWRVCFWHHDWGLCEYVTLRIRDPTYNNLKLASTSSTEHTATSLCGAKPLSKSFWTCDLISAPYCSSKASDSVLLVKWLHRFISLNILNPIVDGYAEILRQMHLWCYPRTQQNIEPWAVDAWMLAILHELHDVLWLRSCGRRSITMGIRAFIMKPKHRALHHSGFHVRIHFSSEASLVSNPAVASCYVNEGLFGRIALLSRRV